MRPHLREFSKSARRLSLAPEPLVERGVFQVPGQEAISDLQPLSPGRLRCLRLAAGPRLRFHVDQQDDTLSSRQSLLGFRGYVAQAFEAYLKYRELGVRKHFGEGGGNLRWDPFRSLARGDVANSSLPQ